MVTYNAYHLDLAFQPVVWLGNGDADHHEVIRRVPEGFDSLVSDPLADPQGEFTAALELALCQGVIQLLQDRPNDRLLLALSWRSCAQRSFREGLSALLRTDPSIRRRLILEFVAADDIVSVEDGSTYLMNLRRNGCRICLSHFGSAAPSYGLLRYFDVDFVKIDGDFFTTAMTDPRESQILREICAFCAELDYQSIASGIDDNRQADMAARLGITMGQGRLYGSPQDHLTTMLPSFGHSRHSVPGQRAPFFLN